jgi:hypothetical protein
MVLVVCPSPSRAGTPGDAPILIESYEGDRAADAGTLLAPVYAELEHRGYVGGDALVDVVRTKLSSDPGQLTPNQLVETQKSVERAYEKLVDGDYTASFDASTKALDQYRSAPALLAHEDAVRSLEQKALLLAARSAQALGRNDDAFKWMAEEIRSFPGQRPNGAEFDPSVGALYRQVSDELARQGHGTLEVSVSDPAAVIFVDERFVGTGHAKLDDAAPGRYRIYVDKGEQRGRVHTVDLAPHGSSNVSIAWEVDGAVTTGPGYVAVAAHGDDLAGAIQLSRSLGAPRLAVIGIRTVGGRRAVVGYSVHVESQTRSYAAIQIEPLAPPEDTMRRLGALLAGDKSVSTADLITTEPAPAGTTKAGMGTRRKLALAVGAAAIVLGGLAVAYDVSAHDTYDASTKEPNNDMQNSLFEDSNRKYHLAQGLAIAGVVGAAAAVTLWFTSPTASERLTVGAAPSNSGFDVVVSGRF